jgi:hypothetical protein
VQSLACFHHVTANTGATTLRYDDAIDPIRGDKSNFFFGLSLSQVGFQAGCVSSPVSNIPFMIDGVLDTGADHPNPITNLPAAGGHSYNSSCIVMFLLDVAVMILVQPNSDILSVKLINKSIVLDV